MQLNTPEYTGVRVSRVLAGIHEHVFRFLGCGPSGERRESVGELSLASPQRVSLLRIAVEKLAAVRFGADPERLGVRLRARGGACSHSARKSAESRRVAPPGALRRL